MNHTATTATDRDDHRALVNVLRRAFAAGAVGSTDRDGGLVVIVAEGVSVRLSAETAAVIRQHLALEAATRKGKR